MENTQTGPDGPAKQSLEETMATGATVLPAGAGNSTHLGAAWVSPVAYADLTSDKLLSLASRIEFSGKTVPALGGIPLLAKLGQGGMGAVYFGIHPRLKQEVAVKVLPFPLLSQHPDLIKRFFREAQIAARVRSPHLVAVTDVNEEHGLFYLVMEYVNGTSAGGYLKLIKNEKTTCLDEASALDICIAATEGLAVAHSEGIVHRDIKPDNILIPASKQSKEYQLKLAKLADLGLARTDEVGQSVTATETTLGTAGYMAPEQTMDAKKARKPADVFSMGATLYALLAGRSPFNGNTAMEMIFATVQQPHTPIAELRRDVSPATVALIDCCLAKDPAQRYADGSALNEALKICRQSLGQSGNALNAVQQVTLLQKTPEAGIPALTPSALAASTPAPVTSGPKRSLLMPLLAGAAVLLILAGLGAWYKISSDATAKIAAEEQARKNAEETAKKEAEEKKVAEDKANKEAAQRAEEAARLKKEDDERHQMELKATKDKEEAAALLKEAQQKVQLQENLEMRRELTIALGMAIGYKRHNNYESAIKALEEPLKALGNKPHPNKEAAQAILDWAQSEKKKHTDYLTALADAAAALKKSDPDAALAAYKRADSLVPDTKETADGLKATGEAFLQLGREYNFGNGVRKDPVQAVRCFRNGADLGNASAQVALGAHYERGTGVELDEKEAVKWYKKAADQNDAAGEYNLGKMYLFGRGVKRDELEAIRLFKLAAAQGNDLAKDHLKRVLPRKP